MQFKRTTIDIQSNNTFNGTIHTDVRQ